MKRQHARNDMQIKHLIRDIQRWVRATKIRTRRMMGARPSVLLAYSRFHFDPRNPEYSRCGFSSAGELAKHIYKVLSEFDVEISYRDTLSKYWNTRSFDLVFSCMAADTSHVECGYRISFPAMSHIAVMNQRICAAAERFGERYPEYVFGSEELDRWRRELAESHRVLIIGNQTVAQTYWADNDHSKLSVIQSGVNYDIFKFAARQMKTPVFLHNPSRLSICKGTYHLLEAWPEVRRACPEAQLWIMGCEGRENGWRTRIEQPGITYLGPYVGASAEHIDRLQQAHFVVLPSLSEGQPGSVLEAMSCGCVPILFDSSGIDAEDYCGFQANFDSTESLAHKMIEAAGIGNEWSERSAGARALIEKRHSWEVFESGIRDILKEYSIV